MEEASRSNDKPRAFYDLSLFLYLHNGHEVRDPDRSIAPLQETTAIYDLKESSLRYCERREGWEVLVLLGEQGEGADEQEGCLTVDENRNRSGGDVQSWHTVYTYLINDFLQKK